MHLHTKHVINACFFVFVNSVPEDVNWRLRPKQQHEVRFMSVEALANSKQIIIV